MAMTGEYKDYYKILEVGKGADEKEIKTAYRKLARKLHPDVNPNDKTAEAKFKEVQEAYEILSDSEKRSKYDQFGDQWKAYSQAGAGAGVGAGFNGYGASGAGPNVRYSTDAPGFGGLDDLFSSLFGGDPRAGGAQTGTRFGGFSAGGREPGSFGERRDIEYTVEILFEESYKGTSRSFTINVPDTCGRCHGNGSVPAGKGQPCPVCGGSGKSRGKSLFGSGVCPQCGGSGEAQQRCPDCNGRGTVEQQKRLSDIKIPAGVKDGQRIRLTGQGASGGDLYLKIKVRPNPRYERKEADLYTDFTIPFSIAALGGEVSVETPEGRKRLGIPQGTQSGQKFRLSGLGMPHLKGTERGNLYAVAQVAVPKLLSPREIELIKELARLQGDNIKSDSK